MRLLRTSDRVQSPDIYDAFLLDMDGVLHRTGVPIDGAGDFLKFLQESKQPFQLLTNECRYTNEQLSRKLKDILGVGPEPASIYSAANSTRDFFARLFRHGAMCARRRLVPHAFDQVLTTACT